MAAFHPRPEDLPTEFAVFPLPGALLVPRGKLPLNIFEPRYLAMVQDSLAGGRMFGMIQPDPNAAEGTFGEGLYRVGCLGRLSSFSETDDGRLLVTLTGLIRFTIDAELGLRRGYRLVRGDVSRFRLSVIRFWRRCVGTLVAGTSMRTGRRFAACRTTGW
jgi:Lon protease-like protein